MPDQSRPLTPAERDILRPLLERRAALAREQELVHIGLTAVLRAFAGDDPSVTLDLETMTLRRRRTPEDAAQEVMAMAGAGNGDGSPEGPSIHDQTGD